MAHYHLYTTLAAWWPLLSPAEQCAEEAMFYQRLFAQALGRPPQSLLELGSGCGPLAPHFPKDMDLTLVDMAEEMLAESRKTNPTRSHVCADMRTLHLNRTFDAVLLHDAVMYLTTPSDLQRTFAVMYRHCAPGGAVLVIPDTVAETFEEFATSGGWADESGRAMQMMEWHWDPDPSDDTISVAFSLMLRDHSGEMRVEHEQHTMGVFSRDVLWAALRSAGFVPVAIDGVLDGPQGEPFLAVKPK